MSVFVSLLGIRGAVIHVSQKLSFFRDIHSMSFDRDVLLLPELLLQDFEFEPQTAAVIAVDVQNDFGSEGGYVHHFGVPIEGARATIEPIGRVLAAARSARMPIVFTKIEFNRDLSNVGGPDSPTRARLELGEGDFLIEGTWNTDIVSELAPQPGDLIVSKRRYSGFYQTDLDELLRARGIQSLIFVGWTTSDPAESSATCGEPRSRARACSWSRRCWSRTRPPTRRRSSTFT